ncbi:hypothetical protein Q5752_007079 [Cryptotrichosporon argae]
MSALATPPTPQPVASSSRLTPPTKRVRVDDNDDSDGEDAELDQSAAAKQARKDARTIRNRESAQRSRNQRKAHLAWLEARVVELEAENRALRTGAPVSTPSAAPSGASVASTPVREASPTQSVVSLANDMGLPPDIVGTGVSLADLAPPPADLQFDVDVKPVVPLPSAALAPATAGTHADALRTENAALRERIGLLENLVKQVVALSSFTPAPVLAPAPVDSLAAVTFATDTFPLGEPSAIVDWDSFTQPDLAPELSQDSITSTSTMSTDIVSTLPAFAEPTDNALVACHPAAVVTPASAGALQRATNSAASTGGARAAGRVRMLARLVVALARIRGWTTASPYPTSTPAPASTSTSTSTSGLMSGSGVGTARARARASASTASLKRAQRERARRRSRRAPTTRGTTR